MFLGLILMLIFESWADNIDRTIPTQYQKSYIPNMCIINFT